MTKFIEHIGNSLKEARLKKNLSQRALSGKTKIPQGHISNIERGEVDLQTSTLIEIARTLNLELMLIPTPLISTVQALMRGDTKQKPMYSLDEEYDRDIFS